jgi:hypothetical protein
MSSNKGRIAVLAAFLAVAVALFVLLQDDSVDESSDNPPSEPAASTANEPAPAPEQPAEPAVEVIELRDGAPVGGVRELDYSKGDRVRIKVKLDGPQEDVHIHGYEIERIAPTETAEFDFTADIEGIFELEAHGPDGDIVLAEIRVEPA